MYVYVKKTPPVIAPEPVTSPEVPAYSQTPGTFEPYYEDDYERVFTYIVKSGGTPDGVRLKYISTF